MSRSDSRISTDRLAPSPSVSAERVRAALSAPDRLVPDGVRCPTCHAPIQAHYCAVCGEERPSRRPKTVVGFLQASLARLLDADNRLFRSAYRLIVRPGALTVAFLNGRRRPFLGPLQLFVTINLAYFLIATTGGLNTFHTPLQLHVGASNFYHQHVAQRWVNEKIGAPENWSYSAARSVANSLAQGEDSPDVRATVPPRASQDPIDAFREFAERFNRQAKWLSKSLVFLLIPGFAIWFWFLYPSHWWGRGRRGLLPFLVQGTHVTGVLLLLLAGSLIPIAVARGLASAVGISVSEQPILVVSVILPLFLYVAASLRRVHGDSGWRAWVEAGVRAGATLWAFLLMMQAYRTVLFVLGFYTA